MKYQLKKLALGGILDQGFSIIRDHASLLLGIVGVSIIPYHVMLGLVLQASKIGVIDNSLAQIIGGGVSLIFLPLLLMTNSAVSFAVSSVYLSRPTTIGHSYGEAMRRFWASLGTGILLGLTIFCGCILFVIPGIVFAFWFALSPYVVVLESMAGTKAMSRSKALMKGNVSTLFVLSLIIGILNISLSVGCNLIPNEYIMIVASAIVQGISTLVVCSMMVVFYFSCRCKLENFDLQVLASEIGKEAEEEIE